VQGADEWRAAEDWPLPGTRVTPLHLRFDGRLTWEEPGASDPSDHFVHDPAAPAPTTPDPRQTRSEGPLDLAPLTARDDLLSYVSEPLDAALDAIGELTFELWAAADAADADWVVTITDVAPDGSAMRVTEGMLRARYRDSHDRPAPLTPGEVVAYAIRLRPTAIRFPAGHRIGVTVAGASFPQYDRNSGSGVAFDARLDGATVTQIVCHDAAHPSRLLLPVV
jgi:uncharacterized protein